jgi:hypothetical protein
MKINQFLVVITRESYVILGSMEEKFSSIFKVLSRTTDQKLPNLHLSCGLIRHDRRRRKLRRWLFVRRVVTG